MITGVRPRTVGRRPPLGPAVLGAAAGGYLFPALTTAVNALFIPDPAIADRLALAAWTTLGIPSASAAVLATVWYHFRIPPVSPSARVTVAAFFRTALVFAALSGAATVVLAAHGVLDLDALSFTVSSAAMGGGIAARRWARTNRPRKERS